MAKLSQVAWIFCFLLVIDRTFARKRKGFREILFEKSGLIEEPPEKIDWKADTGPAVETILNSHCGPVNGPSATDAHCAKMGAAYWFIVVDVSGGSSHSPPARYYEEDKLAGDMVEKLENLLQENILESENTKFAVLMATKIVQVMKPLCRAGDSEPLSKLKSSHSFSLMDDVLRKIDEEVYVCDDYTLQRIILYVMHHDLNSGSYLGGLENRLRLWKDESTLYGNRSTLIFPFVLSINENPRSKLEKFASNEMIRNYLYLNPSTTQFKNLRGVLGPHAVQCACLLSEDCKINATTIKPCHFAAAKKEKCSRMVNERIVSRPKFARNSERQLASCKETRPPKDIACDKEKCLEDCNKKEWSEWSECDKRGNKHRSRLANKDSHSEFTISCPMNESQSCDLTTVIETSTAVLVKTTTENSNVMTSTWALIFALLTLSGSIIGGAVVFLCVRRRRRRRMSRMPHFIAVHRKGRGYRAAEPDSAASTATESRATSMTGQDSVRNTSPRGRKPSKLKKDDQGRQSTSKGQSKSTFRPRTVSVKVNLPDHKGPFSGSKGKSSKIDSTKSSQSVKKI